MSTTALEQFRSRWRRWVGGKTREHNPRWTDLLDSEYLGWLERVMGEDDSLDWLLSWQSSREQVRASYRRAIDRATMDQLYKLDGIYCRK